MKTYRTVLLDMDGTLVDSNDLHAQAWKEALFDRGYYVPFEKIRKLVGMSGDKIIPALTGMNGDGLEAKALRTYRSAIFLSRYLPKAKPFPHVRTLLERMRDEGLQLIATSSASQEECDALIETAGIRDLLQGTIGANLGNSSQPSSNTLSDASAHLGAARDETLLIGDTAFDIQAGHAAAIDVLALRSGGSSNAELQGAVAIYDDPMDLLENFASSPLGCGRRGN